MSRTLIAIGEDMMAIDALLDEVEGDISDPKVEEAITAWLAEAEGNMAAKIDNYAAFITELLGRAKVRSDEAKRMAARARVDKAAADRLKERLMHFFEFHGMTKLETDRYKVSRVKSGGKLPLTIEVPGKDLPEHLQSVVIEPDKEAIRQALTDGVPVPGCSLGERGTHMRIS